MRQRQRPYRALPKLRAPTLWMMTDERVATARLLRAARRLPRGSGIVFRHYRLAEGERRALFGQVRRVATRRGLVLFLAGDAATARLWGADGFHGPGRGPGGLGHSMAAHDRQEVRAAERAGADLIFLSPLFATRSHPGAPSLGVFRFAALARSTSVPIMALGGVDLRHARLVRALGASGFGAIDAFTR